MPAEAQLVPPDFDELRRRLDAEQSAVFRQRPEDDYAQTTYLEFTKLSFDIQHVHSDAVLSELRSRGVPADGIRESLCDLGASPDAINAILNESPEARGERLRRLIGSLADHVQSAEHLFAKVRTLAHHGHGTAGISIG